MLDLREMHERLTCTQSASFFKYTFYLDDSDLKAQTVNHMRDMIKVPLIASEPTALRGAAGVAACGTDAQSDDQSQGYFRGNTEGHKQ